MSAKMEIKDNLSHPNIHIHEVENLQHVENQELSIKAEKTK